jgi:crossover junction endodeoxyribonuclease RusA
MKYKVTLPFPKKELNPNARLHYMALAKAKKAFRETCFWRAKESPGIKLPDTGNLKLTVTFYPPNKRKRDRDNLLASMKSGLDGVADALGLNDSRFEPLVISMSGETKNCVVVEIEG